jgi:hypothetical protein
MGKIYKQPFRDKVYDAETLDAREPFDSSPANPGEKEMLAFDEAWLRATQMFNADGEPFTFFDGFDRKKMLAAVCIMKSFYNGQPFAGMNPVQGEFGIRWPLVEDLVGATDTEWGQNAGTLPAFTAWTAGQRGWLHSAAQNSDTFAAVSAIRLRDTGGGQEWAFVFFGVRSFSADPVVKDVLIQIGGERHAIQQVENKLRGSQMRVAKFDGPFFIHPDQSFKAGVTVRTTDQDMIAPLGFIILSGTRARDISENRPVAA